WSSTMASYLFDAGRSTRPTICRYKPIRARMQQPTSGMSHPSVSTMQLVTTSSLPAANCARTASRCDFGMPPSTCACQWLTMSPTRWLRSMRGELRLDIIAGADFDAFQVQLGGCVVARLDQVLLPDQLGDLRTFDDVVEDAAEPAAVATAWRS